MSYFLYFNLNVIINKNTNISKHDIILITLNKLASLSLIPQCQESHINAILNLKNPTNREYNEKLENIMILVLLIIYLNLFV